VTGLIRLSDAAEGCCPARLARAASCLPPQDLASRGQNHRPRFGGIV
jgi:hypothetical protein